MMKDVRIENKQLKDENQKLKDELFAIRQEQKRETNQRPHVGQYHPITPLSSHGSQQNARSGEKYHHYRGEASNTEYRSSVSPV